MKTARGTITGLAVVAACLVLACSSSGGGPVSSQTACDDYFDALLGISCGASTPPDDEVARVRGRFESVCANALALPGNGITVASLQACTRGLTAAGCLVVGPTVDGCVFQGSLPDGAACNESSQCLSGDCTLSQATGDAGAADPSCGTCTTTIATGDPCKTGQTCAPGATCAGTSPNQVCTAYSYGDAGAACDGVVALCAAGLYCDELSSQCTPTSDVGAPCAQTDACVLPLICTGASGSALTCQQPAPAGSACLGNEDCAEGLGCSTATHSCAAITWAAAGEPCGDLARCLVGSCPIQMGPNGPVQGGNCPAVVADGQPCTRADPTQTCDAFAECANGTCQIPDAVACQ